MSHLNTKWQGLTGKEALATLKSDAAVGLSSKAARSRYRKYGANTLFDTKNQNERKLWRSLLCDAFLWLLLLGSVLCLFFSELPAGVCALSSILVGALLILNCWQKGKVLEEKIEKYRTPYVAVLRDGKEKRISARRIVVGDILLLRKGDIVPADCRLLESRWLTLHTLLPDEKGKPLWDSLPKNADAIYPYGSTTEAPYFENILYGGSRVTAGEAKAVVIATGKESFLGKIPSFPIPCEIHPAGDRDRFTFLQPYLRVYHLLLLALMPILFALGLLTCVPTTSLTGLFLSLCALLGSASAWVILFLLQTTVTRIKSESFFATSTENRAILKSERACESLADLNEILVIGNCGVSDGLPHLYRVATGKGEVPLNGGESYHVLQPLCEAVLLLLQAYRQEDAKALRAPAFCDENLRRELIDASDFDVTSIQSRIRGLTFVGSMQSTCMALQVETVGERYRLLFYNDAQCFRSCTAFATDDAVLPLDRESAARLSEFYNSVRAAGADVITAVCERGGQRILLGVLATKEHTQKTLPSVLEELLRSGVRTTFLFERDDREMRRYLATVGFLDHAVTKQMRKGSSQSIFECFEQNRVFLGIEQQEILAISEYLRRKGRSFAVMSNSEEALPLLQRASVAVITDRTDYHLHANEQALTDQLHTQEIENSTRATQSARRLSDVIVNRAGRLGGGLFALSLAISHCREGRVRANALISVLLGTNLARLILIGASILLGTGLLSGAQILIGGLLTELVLTFWLLLLPVPQKRLRRTDRMGKERIGRMLASRTLWLPPSLSAAGCVLYAFCARLGGWMDDSGARAFLFGSLILISVLHFIYVLIGEGISLRHRSTLYFLLGFFCFLAILFTLCALFGGVPLFALFGSVTLSSMLSLPLGMILYFLSRLFSRAPSHRTSK
ncbi:MAG: hypothetical protein IKB75_03490 [Clostridia bacterium]|nr:hypothetical protein [Clostridia bacterium]